jgi:mitochondrial import inner membrane translocase subunit TIM17
VKSVFYVMRHQDYSRDPCPWNIVYDVGFGFAIGAVGGGVVWHGFKGFRHSPRGERFTGALGAIKSRAPVLGGNFAVWSGLFNACECVLHDVRPQDDIWNPVIAGATTGAILAARSGPRAMLISGLFGGVILAAMEGVGSIMNKAMGGSYDPVAPPFEAPPQPSGNEIPVQDKPKGRFF